MKHPVLLFGCLCFPVRLAIAIVTSFANGVWCFPYFFVSGGFAYTAAHKGDWQIFHMIMWSAAGVCVAVSQASFATALLLIDLFTGTTVWSARDHSKHSSGHSSATQPLIPT